MVSYLTSASFNYVQACLLNYKADGTPFWNQFFVAPLHDANGAIVNFVSVQCEVTKGQEDTEQKRGQKRSIDEGAHIAAAYVTEC